MVARGHRVDAVAEQRISDVSGHTEPGGAVLDVRDDVVDLPLLDERRKHTAHDFAARLREDISDEEDSHIVGSRGCTGGVDALRSGTLPAGRLTQSGAGDLDPDVMAAPLLDAGQDHPQLTLDKRRRGAPGIEGAGDPDRPCEPAERPLREMKRGLTMWTHGGPLPAGNDERSLNDVHADGVECDARQVHENLDRLGGLEHIHGRGALARRIAEGIVVERADVRLDAALAVVVAVIREGARHSARIVARADRGLVLDEVRAVVPPRVWEGSDVVAGNG